MKNQCKERKRIFFGFVVINSIVHRCKVCTNIRITPRTEEMKILIVRSTNQGINYKHTHVQYLNGTGTYVVLKFSIYIAAMHRLLFYGVYVLYVCNSASVLDPTCIDVRVYFFELIIFSPIFFFIFNFIVCNYLLLSITILMLENNSTF